MGDIIWKMEPPLVLLVLILQTVLFSTVIWNKWPEGVRFYQQFELRHDKTNKVSVRPAKTQISLGICPVWSESLLCA